MTSEIVNLISGMGSAVFGCSTLVTYLLYRRASRRIKNAEAVTAEIHAENQRISSLHNSLDVVNDQLQEALRAGADKDRIIEDKTRRIREKDEEIISLYNKLLMCRQSKIRALQQPKSNSKPNSKNS